MKYAIWRILLAQYLGTLDYMALLANDIRVGNYVRLSNQPASEVKLESIHLVEKDYVYSFNGISASKNSFEGIYLTTNWFYLCGFMEVSENEFVIPELPQAIFFLTDSGTEVIVNDTRVKTIYFLHELQNLVYILSGRELNIAA